MFLFVKFTNIYKISSSSLMLQLANFHVHIVFKKFEKLLKKLFLCDLIK